jgi:hypothetical protein
MTEENNEYRITTRFHQLSKEEITPKHGCYHELNQVNNYASHPYQVSKIMLTDNIQFQQCDNLSKTKKSIGR